MLLDSGNVALRGDEWVCMGASGAMVDDFG